MALKPLLTSLLPGRAPDAPAAPTTKRINLALQGFLVAERPEKIAKQC